MTGPTGQSVSSKSKLNTSGAVIRVFWRNAARDFAQSFPRDTILGQHPSNENIPMAADRFPALLALLALGSALNASAAAADPPQLFTVQDLVRLERVSEIASSPDGKRVAYTLRTTDMDANKGLTQVWLADTGKHPGPAQRLTDLAANGSAAQWSADGRFVYFLSNRSGSMQVWRGSSRAGGGGGGAPRGATLPPRVGAFARSPPARPGG